METTFYLWSSVFATAGIIMNGLVAFWIYKLSRQLSARDKFEHEKRITEQIAKIPTFKEVILADVRKYTPHRTDINNQTYYKQKVELYSVIPEFGVQVVMQPSTRQIPVGLIPFDWIEYVREYDSEDNRSIIVCKFKGIKWYRNFKSPLKEISYMYQNPTYEEGFDPKFLALTSFDPELNR